MRQLAGLLIPATLLVVATSPRGQSVPPSPFGMLEPAISIDADDQRKLDAGEVVVQILPASGRELAVLAAASLSATVPEVESRITDIATLKRSRLVPQIGRFSDPPALQDLAELTLDRADLAAIRDCHPGDCDIKLSSHEIGQLRQATNGKKGAEWAAAANLQFRRIMLDRVRAYLARGLSGVPRYDTGDRQTDLSSVFATLLGHSPFIQSNAPQLGIYLTRFPAVAPAEDASSFLYWSKEQYAWKPIISVTHITMLKPSPRNDELELLVVSREVFATRYTSGALVVTMLIRGVAGAPHYLVYINRTWVDGLHDFWRFFINYRVKSQAARIFADARARLEGTPDGNR